MTVHSRHSRLQELAAAQGLDALVAVSPANVQYLTGCDTTMLRLYGETPMWALYLAAEQSTTLIAPAIRLPGLVARGFRGEIVAFGADPFWREFDAAGEAAASHVVEGALGSAHTTPAAALAAVLRQIRLRGRVGMDDARLPAAQVRGWMAALPNHEFVSASQLLSIARMVKSAGEIDRLEKAAQNLEAGLAAAVGALSAGTSELAANRQVHAELALRGGHFGAGALCFGPGGASVLPPAADVQLQGGDVVKWDVAAHFGGYWADTARTACWRTAGPPVVALFDAVAQAHAALLDAVRPGVRAGDSHARAHQVLARAGAPAPQAHVGHGIGLDLYEPPLLAPHDTTTLASGMVLCLENPIFALGIGALTLEDTVVVEPEGARLLTQYPRDLQILAPPEK